MVEVKKNLHDEITRLYPVLLARARGLMRDDDMGHELLHTVLDNCLNSEAVVRTLNELLPRGSVEYYLNRCIYLSAYSKTTKFNKDKVRSVEIAFVIMDVWIIEVKKTD